MNYQAMVIFRDQVIPIEELIGIDTDFVFFNPTRNNGALVDFLIQDSQYVFLKKEGSEKLVNLKEVEGPFNLVNSKGVKIADSNHLGEEVIQAILIEMERQGESNEARSSSFNN